MKFGDKMKDNLNLNSKNWAELTKKYYKKPWNDSVYKKYEKEENIPPNPNLVYATASEASKQNIDLFLNAVFDWVNSFGCNKSKVMEYFSSFASWLLDMRKVPAKNDKERNQILRKALHNIGKKASETVPDVLYNQLDSLFWGV